MATKRRKQILLGALLVVLAAVAYWTLRGTSAAPASSSNQRQRAATRPSAEPPTTTPDVHLEALNVDRPKPAATDRNLFRFKPKPPPAPPPVVAPPPANPVPAGPPPPPPVPPISLKFIGTMTQGGRTIAVLSDGTGTPQYGFEGGTILGRYKILRIGVESIEMSYLDGRGRTTLRLTGG